MFNVGPFELIVLAVVGIVVLGPDRLPGLARDAARMLRTLRDLATGAREQLRDELGPEFADIDLRDLNPRTAVARAVFGDDPPDLSKYDPRRLNPGQAVRDAVFGSGDQPDQPVSMTKNVNGAAPNGTAPSGAAANGTAPSVAPNGSRPRPKPGPGRRYDQDAT